VDWSLSTALTEDQHEKVIAPAAVEKGND